MVKTQIGKPWRFRRSKSQIKKDGWCQGGSEKDGDKSEDRDSWRENRDKWVDQGSI